MAEHTRFEKLVANTKKNITEISPQDAAAKLNNGDAVVVDARDKDEWDGGHIPGATHMSRGTIELDIEEKVRACLFPGSRAYLSVASMSA